MPRYQLSTDTLESQHHLTTLETISDFVVSYLNDEFNENPGSTLVDLYDAFGHLYEGLAIGGDFQLLFQGETIKIEVVYDGLDDLLDTYKQHELVAARHDMGPSPEDVQDHIEDLTAVLPQLGDPEGTWRMAVLRHADEPPKEYEPWGASNLYWNEKLKRAAWPCSLGIVTVWQE